MVAPSFSAGARFDIRRQLGAGGMGVVYEAYDRERGESVALKTLHGARAEWLSRFKREFRSLHDLSHPNLVALGEFFDRGPSPFFTMELVDGVDLLAYVRPQSQAAAVAQTMETVGAAAGGEAFVDPQSGATTQPMAAFEELHPCDEQRLRSVLVQLLEGLDRLHAAGKVHCDIKPTNILVDKNGRVAILDFGLVVDTEDLSEFDKGGLAGTVEYMAPEQASSGPAGPAVDVYSLGVVLFEALTGKLPYTSSRPYDLLLKKGKEVAPSVQSIAPDAPDDLTELCAEMLAPDPAARPSIADLLHRLGATSGKVRRHASSSGESGELFVGRERELRELRHAFAGSRTRASMVIVEGASGVGKSALVERFIRDLRAAEPGAVVLRGRCYEREMVSFKAFDGIVDGLAQYLRVLSRADREALMPAQPALLGRLFPVLCAVDVVKGAPEPVVSGDLQEQRIAMFAALRHLFERVSLRGPLVWFVDDLQWTDIDSLTLLGGLVAQQHSLPVFVVATVRTVAARQEAQKELLERLESLLPVRRLELEELEATEARELVQRLLPGAEGDLADATTRSAGGHPLLLQELARHLSAEGRDAAGQSLDEMLALRISRLPDDARSMLEVLAVAERPIPQEVAAIAAGVTIARAVKAATVLRTEHLARTDGVRRDDSIGTFHDRVREVALARLDDEGRRKLHKRLAQALENTGAAEAAPLMLVRHAEAAGRTRQASVYALRAGRAAARALAFDQAADLLRKALELATFEPDKRRELLLECASALMHAGRGPEAAVAFLAAADGAEPDVRLECQRCAAEQWLITGHIERGLEAMQSSMREIGEHSSASPRQALARLVWNRGRLRLRRLGIRSRENVSPRRLRRLAVLRSLAIAFSMVDNIRGADFNSRYLLAALDAGTPHHLMSAIGQEIVFLSSQSARPTARISRLRELLQEAGEACDDAPYARAWQGLADGAQAFFEGRFPEAVQALEPVGNLPATASGTLAFEKNNAGVFLIHVLRMMGALERQREVVAEQVQAGSNRGDRYLVTSLRFLGVQTQLAAGHVELARQAVDGATWTPPDRAFHAQHWYELIARVEIALYEGRALTAIDELAPTFAALDKSMLLRIKLARVEATALRVRLLLAAARGLDERGRELARVRRLASQLERERIGYASVYAALARAGVHCLEPGSTGEAVRYLREAIELAGAQSMALHEAAARDRLGRLLGGSEGKELRSAAAQFAEAQHLANPDASFETAAPGFIDWRPPGE